MTSGAPNDLPVRYRILKSYMLQGHQNDLPVRYRILKFHMLQGREMIRIRFGSGPDPALDPALELNAEESWPGTRQFRQRAVTPQWTILKPFLTSTRTL